MSISEAKSEIKKWNSLQKIADKLGFYITDEYPDGDYEYVAVPKAMKRHIPVLLALHEQNGFHGNYLLWYLEDIDNVLSFLGGIALAQGKVLTTDDVQRDKWILASPDKFSARDLTNND
jgi:predicted methyltransferase